jgi:PAS domain S-box-containing protein
VLETVPAVVVVLDAQGRVVELNRAGEELTGYSGEEIRGRKLWETRLVPEEEQPGTREVFARLRAGDFPNRYENHWITKDGRWRLLSWRNSAVLDEYGEVSRVIGTAVDVTDERRALEALQESAERFRATLQTLIDPLVLLTAARDADGTVVDFVCAFANDAACAVSGVTREELTGRRLLEFLPESRSSGLFDAFVRVIETGEPFSQDDLVVAVGGVGEQTERHLNIRVTRVGDQVAVTWIDATERRSIEAQLRASEERFRAAAESMLDALFVVSAVRDDHGEIVDFRYEYVNDAHCKLVGFDREQLLGHRIGELFPEYPGSDRFAVYRRVAVTGEPCRTDDVYHEQAWAGTPLATRVVDSMIASVGENLVVSARDVTERRWNEEQLRLRAELLDLAHDAVIVRDPAESRVTFWNREAQAIYGYSPEEAFGRITHELLATVFPESREAIDDALAREGRWVGELRHTRKDGTVIVVSSRQALQLGADGRPSAVIELNSDITERKRVEEELAHVAGLLERTEQVSKTGGWEYDVATGELTWTDEVYRIYGVERTSDPTEVTHAIAAYDPESAPIIDAAFKRLVTEGVPYDLELGLLRADGQRVWVRTIGRPVIDGGRVVRVGGNISDVTERKRVEEALHASDQLFHDGFDYSPTGMALTGLDGRLVEVNAAFARMLGFDDAGQLVGQDFARFTHPDDLAANREGIRMMVEEGKPYVAEKRYIRRDGAVVYALMGSTAVLDADGRPSMLFTQVQDITERKLAEAALRASEERFRGGFENSPIGMALVDPNGKYLEVNTTHARMLGVDDPDEMIGLRFEHFVHPDDVADTYASIERLHETGTDHGERRYIRKDGATVYALFGSSVVRDADGQPSVLFSQAEDITERKLAEAEVLRLNAELEQRVLRRTAELKAANQELEGFAYSLAHDLRAPIRAINGFGAALSQSHGEQLGDQGREELDRIRRASARMGELIDAMLLLSDLTTRELSITSVDLGAVATEISEELRALDPARGVEFVIGDGLETVGDQRLVRVLMRNLLDNAWRYTGPCEHARIEVMRAGAGVFAVRDNGVGFNMDFAELLFKPFARLHREDEFPGIGVGLTTVERIVRRHGGAVWGEGRPGEGATFYFKLEPSTETGS